MEGLVSNLKLAVDAAIPVIAVTTRDPMNFPDVVKHITGKKLTPWGKTPTEIKEGGLYLMVCDPDMKMHVLDGLYQKLVAMEASLIVVNPPKPHESLFWAGEAPVPKAMVHSFMKSVTDDDGKASELTVALGGCTIKEASELAKMAMTAEGALTPAAIMTTRKKVFSGSRGVYQVDTHQDYYEPPDELVAWLGSEKKHFLNPDTDPRLVPRGLLLDGPPGTGKSAGAKFIANRLGVPLYRVNIGSVQEKWVGSSEANLEAALAQLDMEEPCVALFDEIEKSFGQGDGSDNGVTTRLNGKMLWWLQEHRSHVLTVMTTNHKDKLPPEMYRSGRINRVMLFGGLEQEQLFGFAKHLLTTFKNGEQVKDADLKKRLNQKFHFNKLKTEPPSLAHAEVTEVVYSLVKAL